jgi:SAM-dependent methyltransferase
MNNSFTELFLKNKYATDKYDLGYLDNFYDKVFPDIRNNCGAFLEIGVQRGGSVRMWRDYFSDSTEIYGIDIHETWNVPFTHRIIGDAYSDDIVNKFSDNYFDIIVDDGPHTYSSFELLIQKYYSKLKPNGLMIIEDIIRPSERFPLIELSKKVGYTDFKEYDMTGMQKTQHLFDLWAGGLFILKLQK